MTEEGVFQTQKYLSEHRLSVVMSKDQPWTLEPWHVKVSFRKSGFEVPAEAITLPETPITGPDLDLENKMFFVTVTVNLKASFRLSLTPSIVFRLIIWRSRKSAAGCTTGQR